MKKSLLIILLLCSKYSIGQQLPSDVQIRYALQEFGRNLKSHNVKNIMDMSSPSLCIAEYRDRALMDVMPQLVNPVELDTVYFETIVKKYNKIYAKQIAVPKNGPKMISWLRMNNFLALERVGHFEQLMGLADPVSQELMPAKLLGKAVLKRSSSLMFVTVNVKGSTKSYNFQVFQISNHRLFGMNIYPGNFQGHGIHRFKLSGTASSFDVYGFIVYFQLQFLSHYFA